MNIQYALKTAARLVAERSGRPYQTCLTRLRDRDLIPLTGVRMWFEDLVELVAPLLVAAGEFATVRDAAETLAASSVATHITRRYPQAVAYQMTVFVDEFDGVTGRLTAIFDADGNLLADDGTDPGVCSDTHDAIGRFLVDEYQHRIDGDYRIELG